MSEPTSALIAAAVNSVPALLWAILAQDLWRFRLSRRAGGRLYRLLPFLTTCLAASYTVFVFFSLLPAALHTDRPPWLIAVFIANDFLIIFAVSMFHHASMLFPLREQTPSRTWLALNYGGAAAMAFVDAWPMVLPGATLEEDLQLLRALFFSYLIAMMILCVWRISRYARRGIWRPGSLGEARSADLIILVAGVLGIGLAFVMRVQSDYGGPGQLWVHAINAAVGIVLAVPFVARSLGLVTRRVLLAVANVAIALGVCVGVRGLAAVVLDPTDAAGFDVASLLLPLAVVLPAQGLLGAAIDHLLFRRGARRREELHAFLLRLSPELGVVEYARRGIGEVVRVMNLRGAAILFDGDRSVVVVGDIDIEPLRRVWPTGVEAQALPSQPFAAATFRGLGPAMQEALIEADVVAAIPIVSPRRRWGTAFITAGTLGASFTEEDLLAVQTFADQGALGLDAAELLERTVAAERSLAHSEKLATIGELAARVAHEIRNPATAARSLAQQLAREPSPFREEHELIVKEIERIERQVAALLRFARREDLRLEEVDLGQLAAATVGEMRPRLSAAGIDVRLDVEEAVMASADREKLRQVAINLIENALDALSAKDGERWLRIASRADNGSGRLEIVDNGPGVAEEALPRLFEPFFSLKASGTGLGLAIARRTVEAHGGRITAGREAHGGMRFTIELPRAASGARTR